jgi:putative endonuclease
MVAGKPKPSRPSGAEAEDLACAWLQARGLRLRERNYRSRRGEIDLIMQDGEQLVFVEVRYRASSRYGSAAESVTAAKQTRLISAASQYLQSQRGALACRFDVLALSGPKGEHIDWIRDAFQAAG